ncbi:hypothetical protein PG995_000248 [Apiospora arundinis]
MERSGDTHTPVELGSDNMIQRMTNFLTHPGPGTALGSCLLMGFSVSLYVSRRQEKDRYQSLVFLVATTWAVILGKRLGTSANMMALGIVPWALCFAMFLSFAGHALVRELSGRSKRVGGNRVSVPPPTKS